jgi:hypothetical protein
MLRKTYCIVFLIFSLLQAAGFVFARIMFPDSPFDIPSGIFNIGIMVIGSLVLYFYAFNKNPWGKTTRQGAFAFLSAGVVYAVYYLVVIFPNNHAGASVPWLLVLLNAFYIPLLVSSYRYAKWA